MVQRAVDPLPGAGRDAVFMSAADADALGVTDGSPVRLCSVNGAYDGRVFRAPMRPGNLEVHWPEGNVLLGAAVDPDSLEPAFNAVVTVDVAAST